MICREYLFFLVFNTNINTRELFPKWYWQPLMYQFQSLNFDILFARIFHVPAADWPNFDPTTIFFFGLCLILHFSSAEECCETAESSQMLVNPLKLHQSFDWQIILTKTYDNDQNCYWQLLKHPHSDHVN